MTVGGSAWYGRRSGWGIMFGDRKILPGMKQSSGS